MTEFRTESIFQEMYYRKITAVSTADAQACCNSVIPAACLILRNHARSFGISTRLPRKRTGAARMGFVG